MAFTNLSKHCWTIKSLCGNTQVAVGHPPFMLCVITTVGRIPVIKIQVEKQNPETMEAMKWHYRGCELMENKTFSFYIYDSMKVIHWCKIVLK